MPPERLLCLSGPPYKVYEVDIRLGTAFHYRVDDEKRNSVLQITLTYNIPADVKMWYVLIQGECESTDIRSFLEYFSPLED